MLAAQTDVHITPRPKRQAPRSAWKKGQSGNPGGRSKYPLQLKQLAASHTESALKTLVSALTAPKAPWPTKVRAAEIILERGHGRAPITVDPEAANAVGASFVALLDQIAREHTPQVEQPPMINVTPEPSDG